MDAFLTALDIQVEELCGVVLNMPHLDRAHRRDHESAPLILIGPDMLALLVVALMPALDGVEQIRVLPVARAPQA